MSYKMNWDLRSLLDLAVFRNFVNESKEWLDSLGLSFTYDLTYWYDTKDGLIENQIEQRTDMPEILMTMMAQVIRCGDKIDVVVSVTNATDELDMLFKMRWSDL